MPDGPWYWARRRRSSSRRGNITKTSTAPSTMATIPAVYAQSAPSRNELLAPAMICCEYCGILLGQVRRRC